MVDQVAAEAFVSRDYVYCGLRLLTGGVLGVSIRPLVDGELGDEMLLKHKRGFARTIGGVYRGAEFSPTAVRGLAQARFETQWDRQQDLIEWEARDGRARVEDRARKLEAKAGQVGEIERVMLPLRVLYDGYRRRGDFAGMEALQAAVQRSLYRAPKDIERGRA
jgi:hypothetical protein